eukprot:scaffold25149_cov23-Prasinocladus_malaysianus.AAC.2
MSAKCQQQLNCCMFCIVLAIIGDAFTRLAVILCPEDKERAPYTVTGSLAHCHDLLLQRLHLVLHALDVVSCNGVLQLLHLALDGLLHVLLNFVAQFSQLLLGLVHHRVGLVLRVDGLALVLVLVGKLLGLRNHPVDLVAGQRGSPRDGDILALAAALVGGTDAQDAVGVNVEFHLDLRHAAWGRGDAVQPEVAQGLVVLDKLTLAL